MSHNREEKNMKTNERQYHAGDILDYHGHECLVLGEWEDEGKLGITIEPTGDYGFPVDVYEEQV